ncbi:hypothetical protein TNCV_659101 [Trichonephila clavipes]|nr:hypothetical protein TNCV_659101 [Trichonephila clavipes]
MIPAVLLYGENQEPTTCPPMSEKSTIKAAEIHRPHLVDEFLESEVLTGQMNWPLRSLDLTPREHAWDALERETRNPLQKPSKA